MGRSSAYSHINKSGRHVHNKGDIVFYCLLLALPLLQLAIFYFGVNFQSLCMAFQSYDAFEGVFYWDFATNFHRLFGGGAFEGNGLIQTAGFWQMVGNSLLVYLFTSFAGTVLAVFFSYFIYKNRHGSTLFKILLFLPSILPSVLLIIVFKIFVGQALPAFQEFLTGVKGDNILATGGNGRVWIITAFTVWISFGGQVLVYTGAMDQIPVEVLEAGKIDGCTPMRELFHIILPSVLPTVSTFLISGLAGIFTAQNNLFAFTSGSASQSEQTVGYYLYMLIYGQGGDKSQYPFAAFMGLFFTIIIMPFVIGVRKIVRKVSD